jgi:hypothetical protein
LFVWVGRTLEPYPNPPPPLGLVAPLYNPSDTTPVSSTHIDQPFPRRS